jgi:hypothetical protein
MEKDILDYFQCVDNKRHKQLGKAWLMIEMKLNEAKANPETIDFAIRSLSTKNCPDYIAFYSLSVLQVPKVLI